MKHTEGGEETAPAICTRRARSFSKAQRAGGAAAIERRTAWLRWPLVYWAGSFPDTRWPTDLVYRPAASLVAERLSRAPAGLYALLLEYSSAGEPVLPVDASPVNPAVIDLVRVTNALVADTMSALQAALKYPKELPKRVGNLEAWRSRGENRLRIVSGALAALGKLDGNGPEALGVEAAALWVGPEGARPSRTVSTPALETQGTELAAIVLGQRHVSARLAGRLKPLQEAGAVLSQWPPDLLLRMCHSPAALRAIAGLGHSRSLLNATDVVAAGVEYVWAAASPNPAGLGGLASLSGKCTRLGPGAAESPWWIAYAGLIGRACAFSDPATATSLAAWWLDSLKSAFPQKGGEAALQAAVSSFQHWFGMARWRRANLGRLFAVLPEIAPRLLGRPGSEPWDPRTWHSVVESHGILGQLAALAPDEQRALSEHGLHPDATRVLRTRPPRIRILLSLPARWLAAARSERPTSWSGLVLLPNEKLVLRLVAWLETQPPGENSSRVLDFLDDLLCLLEFSGTAQESAAWQSLFERHTWLCSELLARYPWPYSFRLRVFSLFAVLSEREKHAGISSLRALSRWFLRDPEQSVAPNQYFRLCSDIAGADDKAFLRLLGGPAASVSDDAGDPRGGWSFLGAYPDIRRFLSECAGNASLTGRAWRVLRRLDLALRLQSRAGVRELVLWWQRPAVPVLPGLPAGLPSDLAECLGLLAAYRLRAGQHDPLPKAIAKLLSQPAARRVEIARLREMDRRAALPPTARQRLANLERYESEHHPEAGSRTSERIRCACERNLVPARLASLEVGLLREIDRHWDRIGLPAGVVHESPDWENALHLYVHIHKNRRLLRQLVLEEARGNRAWMAAHPANAAFLDWMRASHLDAQRWLAPAAEAHRIDGGVWTVCAETDPLRVLQMGNIFSTCLSAGGMNAFSTVANAVEMNKRVLYIRDERGATVGRRLIGIGKHQAGPVLIAFRAYGACDAGEWSARSAASPWVRILFDILCSRLARAVGAVFTSDLGVLDPASETLQLFAKWYNDGPQAFDWWTTDPETRDQVLAEDRGAVARALLYRLRNGALWQPDRDYSRPAAVRALIWLGDEAISLAEELGEKAFTTEELHFLARFTREGASRALFERWMRHAPAGSPAGLITAPQRRVASPDSL